MTKLLKIQDFIQNNVDWKEKLSSAPYNLKISEKDGYVLFMYSRLNSNFNQEICREARGLILDSLNNFEVARLAFTKFFNIGEEYAAKIDWDSAFATEKIDGSIMSLWQDREGGWRISTNGTIDAFDAPINGVSEYQSFGKLFMAAKKFWFSDLERFSPDFIYTFELVSPYNRVVLAYPRPELYLLSIRSRKTLEEVDIDSLKYFGRMIHTKIPNTYCLHSEEEYMDFVSKMGEDKEGIVVRDKYNNRVKIKTESYFRLHKLNNNGNITVERIVDIIRENEQSEFLSYFPHYAAKFAEIKKELNDIKHLAIQADVFVHDWRNYNGDKKRKEFAEHVSQLPNSFLYFWAYDRNLDRKMSEMSAKQLVKAFKIGEKYGVGKGE